MALEQAGVDLQAKGFQDYLRKLDAIEKKQRAVFDQQFKDTAKSYDQITRAAKDYEQQLKKTSQSQSQFGNTLAGIALGAFSQRTLQATVELAKAAAAFDGQSIGLNNLAAQYGESGNAIRDAMRTASNGVLSESAIIQAANQALLLGVAKTPEQFEEITSTAITLGRAMGLDATQAIEQFTTALGRKSLLILDNFGISSKQVRAEMEQLAQVQFGEALSALDESAKDALFMQAALKVAGEAAATIGEESGAAAANFDRLAAQSENLKLAFGEAVLPSISEMGGLLSDAVITAQQLITIIGAGGAAIGAFFEQLGGSLNILENIREKGLQAFRPDILLTGIDFTELFQPGSIEKAADAAGETFNERFKAIARTQGITFPEDKVKSSTAAIEENSQAVETNQELIDGLQSSLKQAEDLELSFARAAEDAARKLERQQEKLGRTQAKDREKLLIKQQKDLDKFEKNRLSELAENEESRAKAIAKAEQDIAKEQERANKEKIDAQKQLQKQLAQQAEQFRLSQSQSERRFQLDEKRLRAEGDILGLQQLRENHTIEQLEAQENFDLQQKQTKEGEQAQSESRVQEQQARLEELKANLDQERKDLEINLEEQRAELLTGFDEQLLEQQTAQAEQRQAMLESFAEQEEDRRINQERQLEDLGRNLAEQKDLTAAGALAIATELEKVFGVEGVADAIFGGFKDRTESDFKDLFANIEDIVRSSAPTTTAPTTPTGRAAAQLLGVPSFQEGGVVPGPIGSPQLIRAEGGETILPTHKMSTPIIPSQMLNVAISGGFGITGGDAAGQAIVQAAIEQTISAIEISLERLTRRNV